MASSPQFSDTPVFAHVTVATADSAHDGTATPIGLLLVGQGYGTRVELIRIYAPGTVAAGKIYFFIDFGQGWKPFYERLVSATTPSASVLAFIDEFEPKRRFSYIPPGVRLGVSTLNASTFHVTAEGSYASRAEVAT